MENHSVRRITRAGLVVVGSLVAVAPGSRRMQQAPALQATVRELATLQGEVSAFFRLPNGHVLLYTMDDTSFAYDIVTKRRTVLGTGMKLQHVSAQGNRVAFRRSSGDQNRNSLWTMPLDPSTGAATGGAQNISLRPIGTHTKFSPDGRTLVYAVGPRPDSTWDITVGPVTGGPERIIANYPFEVFPFWSADGKWLYIERYGAGRVRNRHETYIERVPLAGGQPEVLFPVHPALKEWFEGVVGVSIDGRIALYMRNPDQFFYMTSSGATGEITVPFPPLDDGWGHDATLDSERYLTLTQVSDESVHVLDLATGQVRSPFRPDVRSITPAWSPDGHRLVVRTGHVSDYAITVMNADGSDQRRYPVSPDLREHQDWGSAMRWSPDGRLVAFEADARQKLAVLDVRSGTLRILTTSPGEGLGGFAWRSGGSAIVTSRLRERAPPWGLSILEVRLDGTERLLRDLSAEVPWALGAIVVSDRIALARDRNARIVSIPTEGGAMREVPMPVADSGARISYSGSSPDGKWIFGEIVGGGPKTDLLIMSTSGEPGRIIQLPFESAHRGVAILPDGRHIIVAGRTPGDLTLKIFAVPLEGGAPREFGGIPGHQFTGVITLSPDGKQVAFTTTERRYTSTIFEVDFAPSLQVIGKR